MKPPDPGNWTGNVDYEWRTLKQLFMMYLQALGRYVKPDARKIAPLLTVAGPLAVELYSMFVYSDEDKDNWHSCEKV